MGGYENYEGGIEEEKEREKIYNSKAIHSFSIISFLALILMSIMYDKLPYSIPYIILFYSVILLLERFSTEKEQTTYLGLGFLYLLLLLISKEMFIGILMILPVIAYIWLKEGKKEDAEQFILWNLLIYILYYSLYAITVSIYVSTVFPHIPNQPITTYILLLFPLYYVLFLAYFYHLLHKLQDHLEGKHKIYKREYAILYSSIYTLLLCAITYLTITGI